MNRNLFIALSVALAVGPQAAAAEPSSGGLPAVETRPDQLQPGMWVTYTLINSRLNQAAMVRLAALERTGKGQWFEVSVTDSRRRRIVFRTLVSGVATKAKKVIKAIIQPPGQRAFFVPSKMATKQLPPFQTNRYKGGKLVGKASVRVAAGTFTTRHYLRRNRDGSIEQAWLCDKLPGWPLVKFVSREMHLELTGRGTDAKSDVQGRPIKLSPQLQRQLQK